MAGERLADPIALPIPHPDGLVMTTTDNILAIGAEGY